MFRINYSQRDLKNSYIKDVYFRDKDELISDLVNITNEVINIAALMYYSSDEDQERFVQEIKEAVTDDKSFRKFKEETIIKSNINDKDYIPMPLEKLS